MAEIDAAVIREATGPHKVGDVLTGKALTAFMRGKPNAAVYHAVKIPGDDTPDAPDPADNADHKE